MGAYIFLHLSGYVLRYGMGKLDDAKRAARERAQSRAERVETSPPEGVGALPLPPFVAREFQAYGQVYEDASRPKTKKEMEQWARAPVVEGRLRRGRPARAEAAGLAVTLKLSPAELGRLKAAAYLAGLPLSVWARGVLLKASG